MANWWDEDSTERYWCEVTDRDDLGADLKAPMYDQAGDEYWSYNLIKSIQPGDVVYHYYTPKKAFVGASVAGGPVTTFDLIWHPHGTAARNLTFDKERPGWRRPLHGFVPAREPLALSAVAQPSEVAWLRDWSASVSSKGPPRIPFQIRRDGLRAGQGYLFKMPKAAVERWDSLAQLAEQLEDTAEKTVSVSPAPGSEPEAAAMPKASHAGESAGFKPKSDADYVAFVKGSIQHRTRSHERLVRFAGEYLRGLRATVSTPHPIDLLISGPARVIIEAKTTRAIEPLFAIRAAVGQLMEYRYFIGPKDAELAVLLDKRPPDAVTNYAEQHLHLYLLWQEGDALECGPETSVRLMERLRRA